MKDLILQIKEKIARLEQDLENVAKDLEVVRKNDSDEEIAIKNELLDKKLMLEGALNSLKKTLGKISINYEVAKDRIGIGQKIEIEMNGEIQEITLVPDGGVDPSKGIFSSESPLGKALLGRDEGETVILSGPLGDTEVNIVRIN